MQHHWSELYFALGFVAYLYIRGKFIQRSKQIPTRFARIDWIERILFAVVFLGNLLIPALYLGLRTWGFADYSLGAYLPWMGVMLLPVSLWLFWRSHIDLGDNWSATLEIREQHSLIKNGVYRYVRHPMYAAILLFGLAQGLLLHNWFAGWSALVTFWALYLIRAPREEKMLREVFGPEYVAYSATTGRLFPRLGPRR